MMNTPTLECSDITKSASRDTWRPAGPKWFEGLTITLEENGNTLLSGPVADQAALHGLLKKVRDLGMPLVSVNLVQTNRTNSKKEK